MATNFNLFHMPLFQSRINVRLFKYFIVGYLSIISLSLKCQLPENDYNWIYNTAVSDEFNGSLNSNWSYISPHLLTSWGVGNQIMIPEQIEFLKGFIRMNANAINGTNYSAGIMGSGFGFGYYEIEARVIQGQGNLSGLWPAFWTLKGSCSSGYYEEIDVFEPGACQINNQIHDVGIWYYPNPDSCKQVKHRIQKPNIDFSSWHKYSIEWFPNKVIFYLDGHPIGEICSNVPTHLSPTLF